MFYRLGYPNREVRQSLNESLLEHLVKSPSRQTENRFRLHTLLRANDFAGLKDLFHAFYASIPYEWYTNNDIARFEGYYASVFYSYFAGLGLDVTVEDSSNLGRLDMAVRFNGQVYLFEAQGGGAGGRGLGDGAVEGAGIRGQVPGAGRADTPGGGGAQRRGAQRGRVRGGARLTRPNPWPERANALRGWRPEKASSMLVSVMHSGIMMLPISH